MTELSEPSRISALEERVSALEELHNVLGFTAEDVELIKAHVRHPGAIEAAKLKERIRLACFVLDRLAQAQAPELTQLALSNIRQVLEDAP